MNIKSAVAVLSLFVFVSGVFAADLADTQRVQELVKSNPDFYKPDPNSVTVEMLGEETLPELNTGSYSRQAADGASVFATIDNIVNLGNKILDVIAANKPVVNVATMYATALPQGSKHWNEFGGWKRPRAYLFGWQIFNVYHMKLVDLRYKVLFTYGGGYQGKGQFLTNVTVQPLKLDVPVCYTVDVKAEVPDVSVVNVGTETNPIAAMTVIMHIKVSTMISHNEFREVFYIQGNGEFKKLG